MEDGVLGAGDCEHAVDQPGQSGQLGERAGHLAGGVAAGYFFGEQLQAQPDGGQRRAELVGHIGDHRLMAVDQCFADGRPWR